jgi:hypothetical protein
MMRAISRHVMVWRSAGSAERGDGDTPLLSSLHVAEGTRPNFDDVLTFYGLICHNVSLGSKGMRVQTGIRGGTVLGGSDTMPRTRVCNRTQP